MDVSVLIPTRGRPERMAVCVGALARQTLPPSCYEVLLGLDGPDELAASAAREAWDKCRARLEVVTCGRAGYSPARNRLLEHARGRVLVSLNDDVVPAPELLEAHLAEQDAVRARGGEAVIMGNSPWKIHEPDRLIDRLIRETSMVFFYDRMGTDDPDRDWGFRHAWGLNCSIPLDRVREVGGWTAFPFAYGYDDLELAHRLQPMPVLYRPTARAEHDHRYEPDEYLMRELRLGHSAWLFAREHPAFARALFGCDPTTRKELSYFHAFVHRERGAARRLLASFRRLAEIPADAVDGPHGQALIRLLYEQHLLLKRWMWRSGLLEAAADRSIDALPLPDGEPPPPEGPPITQALHRHTAGAR